VHHGLEAEDGLLAHFLGISYHQGFSGHFNWLLSFCPSELLLPSLQKKAQNVKIQDMDGTVLLQSMMYA